MLDYRLYRYYSICILEWLKMDYEILEWESFLPSELSYRNVYLG